MSGHSKWHNIKIRKSKVDAQKGKLFTKYTREIIMAAKDGGGNPDTNNSLKKAIEKAKEVNMPSDNIKRAIQRGTGELPGVSYESQNYEGYGTAGVAILVETLTDNKQRTVADIRYIFSKYGGSMGETGCVGWIFERKGQIIIEKEKITEEELLALALESGAEDVQDEGDSFSVITSPEDFENVKKVLEEKNLELASAEITRLPKNTIKVDRKHASSVLKLVESLEENDDVQNVYANFDIDEKILNEISR